MKYKYSRKEIVTKYGNYVGWMTKSNIIEKLLETKPSTASSEMELRYCEKCIQMTNHEDGVCLKCKPSTVFGEEEFIKFMRTPTDCYCVKCGKHYPTPPKKKIEPFVIKSVKINAKNKDGMSIQMWNILSGINSKLGEVINLMNK